jgi:hypothetical protein
VESGSTRWGLLPKRRRASSTCITEEEEATVSKLLEQFLEDYPHLSPDGRQGAGLAFLWLAERLAEKRPPPEKPEKDRFIKATMPDGKVFFVDVRAVSVAYSNAKMETPEVKESLGCFGSHAAIDAGADLAAEFRAMSDEKVIEEARKLPLVIEIVGYMTEGILVSLLKAFDAEAEFPIHGKDWALGVAKRYKDSWPVAGMEIVREHDYEVVSDAGRNNQAPGGE